MESFVAVIEAGSYAEAARRLDLTAAAIAARIKALEDDIGVPLVKRSGRFVRPTPHALNILESTRAALRNIRDLRALAQNSSLSGEFRIGCFISALTNILPPLLKQVYLQYPAASLFVTPGASIELCRKVVDGELDAAIVVEPQFPMPKSCTWLPFIEEPLIVVAHMKHEGQQAHDLLRTQPFIRYDRHILGGQLADRYLRDHQIFPTQRLEIDSLSSIVALVAEGLGVSLVPDWSTLLKNMPVVRIALPARAPVRRSGLIWNTQGHHADMASCIYEQAAQIFHHPSA